jgi:hypothetical protein
MYVSGHSILFCFVSSFYEMFFFLWVSYLPIWKLGFSLCCLAVYLGLNTKFFQVNFFFNTNFFILNFFFPLSLSLSLSLYKPSPIVDITLWFFDY